MANTYDTSGEPLGSKAPKVLYNNAENLDVAVNSQQPSWVDRPPFNRQRRTWWGMEQDFNNFLINSGYETVHLTYVDGVPLQVDRPTQLIDRAPSVYRVKMPASFPVMLTGNWTTDQNLLVDVGDASLRTALAAPTGSTLVGFQSPYAEVSVQTVAQALARRFPTVEEYGAIGDNVVDDTAALQKAVKNIGLLGGGTLRLTPGKKYYVPGSIIVPTGVSIDLSGCTLRGNRPGGGTASMFKSGYFDSGNLVDNLSAPFESVILDNVHIFNGFIESAYRGFEYRNANRTCSISDISFNNCIQAFLLTRCYSIGLENLFAHTGSDPNIPLYKCVNAVNAILFNRVRAVVDFAFEIDGTTGGAAAVTFLNCDVEGSATRGYYLSGAMHSVNWIGCYHEAIQGTLYDMSAMASGKLMWEGNFHYLIKNYFDEPVDTAVTLSGSWDTTNTMEGIGQVVGPVTYDGRFSVQHPRNAIKFRLDGNFVTSGAIPNNVLTTMQSDVEIIAVRWATGPGDVLSKAIVRPDVLPQRYMGDTGRNFPNQVAFATHQALVPGSSSITIVVDTKIAWRPDTIFAKYRFKVTDGTGAYILFGDIYGDAVKAQDSVAGKIVLASNNGGFLRLALSGFTHPSGVYTCEGLVPLCV